MRLVNLGGRVHALHGPLDEPDTGAIDLARLTGLPSDPAAFLVAGGLDAARAALPAAGGEAAPVAGARPGPPVPRPRMVWAVGLNYRDHAAETGRPPPEVPTLFVKSPGAIVGPGDAIVVPPHVAQPDYEGEVAVVIGREVRDVPAARALDAVAGVTVAHDVSARDHQFNTGQFSWSKSFDTFLPLGPVLVTLDELDAGDLHLETRLNGDVVQSATTADLVFGIAELVAWISQGLTLVPGDLVLTGTPAGVGAARTPPRFLQDGDVVAITVEGIGTLSNPVVRTDREASASP